MIRILKTKQTNKNTLVTYSLLCVKDDQIDISEEQTRHILYCFLNFKDLFYDEYTLHQRSTTFKGCVWIKKKKQLNTSTLKKTKSYIVYINHKENICNRWRDGNIE